MYSVHLSNPETANFQISKTKYKASNLELYLTMNQSEHTLTSNQSIYND
jgi:hypothetical protein